MDILFCEVIVPLPISCEKGDSIKNIKCIKMNETFLQNKKITKTTVTVFVCDFQRGQC